MVLSDPLRWPENYSFEERELTSIHILLLFFYPVLLDWNCKYCCRKSALCTISSWCRWWRKKLDTSCVRRQRATLIVFDELYHKLQTSWDELLSFTLVAELLLTFGSIFRDSCKADRSSPKTYLLLVQARFDTLRTSHEVSIRSVRRVWEEWAGTCIAQCPLTVVKGLQCLTVSYRGCISNRVTISFNSYGLRNGRYS